jgi:hypothetical protein
MAYTTESGVYQTTQFTSDMLQDLLEIPETEVTTWITALIEKAEAKLREDVNVPYAIRNQLILADGYTNQFDIGDHDDGTANWLTDSVENNLVSVKRVRFNGRRKQLPYPSDCDVYTDYSTPETDGWSGTNVTITGESTVIVSGEYSVKAQFSDAGYIQFPGSTNYFNRMIYQHEQIFLWFRTSNIAITNTIKLYDTSGYYTEQEFSPRLDNQGQYFWLDLANFTDGGNSVDWSTDYFQYFRIYVSGACTIYIDNWCFTDDWAYSAPSGIFHVVKADNISTDGFPTGNYPFQIDYTYDPFLDSTPSHIQEAVEWLTGVYIIDGLRDRKYGLTDFRFWSDTMEQDIPQQGSGVLGIRTKMINNYKDCLVNYGGSSWGVIM